MSHCFSRSHRRSSGTWQDMNSGVITFVAIESSLFLSLLIPIRVSNGDDAATFTPSAKTKGRNAAERPPRRTIYQFISFSCTTSLSSFCNGYQGDLILFGHEHYTHDSFNQSQKTHKSSAVCGCNPQSRAEFPSFVLLSKTDHNDCVVAVSPRNVWRA